MNKFLKQIIALALIGIFTFSPVLANAKVSVKRPARVKSVSAKALSKSTIKISWKKVKGAKGYKIYRSTAKNKKFKLIKTTKRTYFKNSKLKSNKKYFYKVKAYKTKGKKVYLSKKYSKIVSAKTPAKKPIIKTPPVEDKPIEEECLLGESCLNINGTGADNMIWSWWYYPQVVSHQNKLFFCFTTNDSYCGIAQYDQNTKQVTKTTLKKATTQDDHNSLALTLLDDNKILCAYAGGHNTDNNIHIRISKNALDISQFEHSIVLRSSGRTCYSQIIKSNGKYYLFYRVNNNNWAYRCSENGIDWSDEIIFVKAGMQYYCKVMPTTDEALIRIIMYSNPSNSATEIRMGFLNTSDNSFYNSDGVTKVANEKNAYTDFNVILDKPTGKNQTQRLFDVAVTDPQNPEFLYTVFSKTKGSEDSVYYLFVRGEIYKICNGGKPLMDPKYQLGASFIDKNNIVVGRNEVGTDYIETYYYNGESVSFSKTIDTQIGCAAKRNARPIVDINAKAFLWHNGYYNKNNYTDFKTSARIYFIDSGEKIIKDETTNLVDMADIKPENNAKADEYIRNLAEGSKLDDYFQMGLKWEPMERKTNWIYYTGLVFEGLLEYDFEKYKWQIKDFYDQYINEN
ncbi:MAG: BNR-4 repeat-containing protein, partial [Clostridia bacterium]|nr:BNR-4 repeat-containing protein [Clostridia bacterium]